MTALLASLLLLAGTLDRDTSIRSTDWKQFFLSDTVNYYVDTTENDIGWGTYIVSLKQFSEEGSFAYGYPMTSYATFGDIDGDGIEEATIEFYTGGSVVTCSYVIIKKTATRLLTWYQYANCGVLGRIENDTLNIYTVYPTGYDYNRMRRA